MFMKGNHVIRQTDAYWCRMSTDLTIEQELMCSVNKVGGLTRDQGMTEIQHNK